MTSNGADAPGLILREEVPAYLHQRGFLPSSTAEVTALGGGVSNVVFAVRTDDRCVVVKQALPQLRVRDRWEADPARALREAAALDLLYRLTPDVLPHCLHTDPQRCIIVIEHAPSEWVDWKSRLLNGVVDPAIAARLGEVLATWHAGTAGAADASLADRRSFVELRVEPFYRTVMTRRPDLSDAISGHLDRMWARQECLVHGDFSPKNVLTGPDGLWVIDLEVAHRGDPAFDLAFLITHLILKSVHLPMSADPLWRCVEAFLAAYDHEDSLDVSHLTGHVGCLLLARILGKSPVEYLDSSRHEQVLNLGEHLVRHPAREVAELKVRMRAAVSP